METTLQATTRSGSGKSWARKLSAAGQLPGVVYGPVTAPRPISVDPVGLIDIFKQSGDRNTIVDLSFEDGVLPCLVREVQRHPVTREILHVDFYAVPREDKIEVMVPLRPTCRPRGAVLGGRIRLIRRKVRVACRYDRIPESFVLDTTPMDIGDMVKASDISTPEGVELVYDNDYNVLTVYGKRRGAAGGEKS